MNVFFFLPFERAGGKEPGVVKKKKKREKKNILIKNNRVFFETFFMFFFFFYAQCSFVRVDCFLQTVFTSINTLRAN